MITTDPRLPLPPNDAYLQRLNLRLTELFRTLDQRVSQMWADATREGTFSVVTTNTSMSEAAGIYVVTASGVTLTLPAASAARKGKAWTVNFSTTGTLTIQRAGSDTIMTPTSATDTSVVVTVQGTTLNFLCASASTWVVI